MVSRNFLYTCNVAILFLVVGIAGRCDTTISCGEEMCYFLIEYCWHFLQVNEVIIYS